MSEVIPLTLAEEYKKHENVKPEDIQILREWIKTQSHLPHERITGIKLIEAARGKDNFRRIDREWNRITLYCTSHSNLKKQCKKQITIHAEIQVAIRALSSLRRVDKEIAELALLWLDDMDLVLAYHSCVFDIELTQKGIDLNYTLKTLLSFYQNREINDSLERACNCWLVTPLTTLTNKGYRPIYCQLLDPDPNHFVYSDVVKAFVMIVDLCLYEEGTVPGIAVLLNMDKVSLSHLTRVDLNVAQQFFYFLQEAMFVRLKEFHFINAPSFMDKLMSMFKPFMKENLLQIVHSHQAGSNTLNEFLPISALPKDAGGEKSEGSILKDMTWAKIKANIKFFKDESKKTVNESVRPERPKTIRTFFPSFEASFKTLEID